MRQKEQEWNTTGKLGNDINASKLFTLFYEMIYTIIQIIYSKGRDSGWQRQSYLAAMSSAAAQIPSGRLPIRIPIPYHIL